MTLMDPRHNEALEQAIQWYIQLQVDAVEPQDHPGWQQWLQQSPANQWAWQQLERVRGRLQRVPAVAGRTLELASQAQHNQRRSVLKGLALLLGGGSLGWGGYDQVRNGALFADYRTQVGQRLPVTLADGGTLLLNTDTALDVRYDPLQRRVRLRQGEVMIATAAEPAGRPFFVETSQGLIQALGTRFSVRVREGQTEVAVFEHQVRVSPRHGEPVVLQAGQWGRFSALALDGARAIEGEADAWTQGLLVVNEQRLDAFLPELARYRSGWLRVDPAVAGLQVSGTFPLDDTDKALRAITSVLPVTLEQRTRYWVTVRPLKTL